MASSVRLHVRVSSCHLTKTIHSESLSNCHRLRRLEKIAPFLLRRLAISAVGLRSLRRLTRRAHPAWRCGSRTLVSLGGATDGYRATPGRVEHRNGATPFITGPWMQVHICTADGKWRPEAKPGPEECVVCASHVVLHMLPRAQFQVHMILWLIDDVNISIPSPSYCVFPETHLHDYVYLETCKGTCSNTNPASPGPSPSRVDREGLLLG